MIKNTSLLIILSCLLNACNTLEEKIIKQLDTSCDTCTIDLREVTDFEWSKFYFFPSGTTEEDINDVIGQRFPALNYMTSCIVFLNSSDSIVFYEQYDKYSDAYAYTDGEVVYLPYTNQYLLFTSPYFKYKVNEFEAGTYYELYQDE